MHEVRQAVNSDNIVNLFIFENINTGMWKYQNYKEFIRAVEEDKKNVIESIFELPKYAAFIRQYEILWGKKRSEFNELEREHLDRKYNEIEGDCI
ncbi:hypothetical protein CHF27_011085 [Romboutsia maritimum]|uniref:Uncharacterized protein n=1 Tax=Romboutsia maritimum TaxID=2020948 RepID=A0A371IQU3_9FIRM|nr:hypothetical protein [Romboutsia maritimum]RDY22857.1 hypothetical protein CHF27_011085 [Romboutsia maritimum]